MAVGRSGNAFWMVAAVDGRDGQWVVYEGNSSVALDADGLRALVSAALAALRAHDPAAHAALIAEQAREAGLRVLTAEQGGWTADAVDAWREMQDAEIESVMHDGIPAWRSDDERAIMRALRGGKGEEVPHGE